MFFSHRLINVHCPRFAFLHTLDTPNDKLAIDA